MAIENTYLLGKNITLGCGFDLQAKAPLDSRQTVPTFEGLRALIIGDAAYEGMIVYDEGTKKTYQAQKCESYSVEVDGKTKTYDIAFREFGINESELKELIASETTAAMEFKGATATLPESPAKGDMWKVTASFEVAGETTKVGDSIVYNGEEWFRIPSGDDIEDTWRIVKVEGASLGGVADGKELNLTAGDKLDVVIDAETGAVVYKHEEIAAPTATPVGEDEQTRTYIASIETDGFGHITGYKTATENVEDTNTTYEFEGLPVGEDEGAPSSVYFQVKSSEEEAAEVIYLDAYNKNEADAAFKAKRAEALAAVATDANVFVDTVAQDVDGNITITTKAVDFSAITDRLDDLEAIDHTHNFADEEALNGITAAKVVDWDDAVSKEHTHSFVDSDVEDAIAKKHAHTFVDTDVEDAISKKHSHTFVEAELNKIADGDVAKWNDAYAHSQVDHAPADAQANIIESVKVNGTVLEITDKAVDIAIPTGALAGKDKVAKTDLADALATEIDGKVASVAAGDASVTVGGTATAPTVAVKLSAAEGNALTLAEDGLKVIIPESTKVEASETNGNIKVDGQEVTVYTSDSYTKAETYTQEEVDAAVEAAKTDASNKDTVVLAEAQKGISNLASVVYTKEEVEALISAAHTWGEF